jgi:micrococcal nuclease
MRTRRWYDPEPGLVAAAVLAVALVIRLTPKSPVSDFWTGECSRVIDGSTIVVLHDGREETVRLHGIDCPEPSEPLGSQVTQFVSEQVLGRRVVVTPVGADALRSSAARVHTPEGRYVNFEIVRAGLARWSQADAPDDVSLKEAEQQAQAAEEVVWVVERLAGDRRDIPLGTDE